MFSLNELKEHVRSGMVSELDAVSLYESVAGQLEGDTRPEAVKVREVFLHIQQEEQEHQNMLNALLVELDPLDQPTAETKLIAAGEEDKLETPAAELAEEQKDG
jgi:rubrerythrin